MKKRMLILLMLCMLLTGLAVPASASEPEGETASTVSTDLKDMKLSANAGGHYVNGNGMGHSPDRSFLYANEKGGLTLVQYYSAAVGVTVAEFDSKFQFLNTRTVPVEGIYRWGGFYAGESYNYLIYSVDRAVLHIDQYSKDWQRVNSRDYSLQNTKTTIDNDLDVAGDSNYLYIATNHYMTSGHQANQRLQINAETLALVTEQSGTATYTGYCSHSYVPEIVRSGSSLYVFDRSDSYPTSALLLTRSSGGLAGGTLSSVRSMAFGDWGSLGNAIPTINNGALAAYTYASASSGYLATNVYLYHTGGTVKQLTFSGKMGTPWVGNASNTFGFVLCNPDIRSDLPKDDLYYAAFTVSGSYLNVGGMQKVEGHRLSDCEPISFKGELVWFTVESDEVVFHRAGASGFSKVGVHNWITAESREPTCAKPGLTEGIVCKNCGEFKVPQEEIPALPHTEQAVPGRESTCAKAGLTAGVKCSVCKAVLVAQEELPTLPHTEEAIPGREATCSKTGLTEGKKCTVCYQITVRQNTIPKTDHTSVTNPGYPPSCKYEGRTDGLKCSVCGLILDGGQTIPKADHTEAETAEVPPTATKDGKTAGTACSVCGQQLTGGEPIPKTLFEITEQKVDNGKLTLFFQRDQNYVLMFTIWDSENRLLDVKFARRDSANWWANTYVSFDLPEGAVTYKGFALWHEGDLYAPVCNVRTGTIESSVK